MRTVFIVDDNDANLFTAQKALSEHYKVFTLPSAAAMFELLEDVIPDLILLDIMMPDMDGFTAMRMKNRDERYKDIPVIFLTGQKDSGTETEGLAIGAVDFIPKPFNKVELLRRIEEALLLEVTEIDG